MVFFQTDVRFKLVRLGKRKREERKKRRKRKKENGCVGCCRRVTYRKRTLVISGCWDVE